MASLGGSVGGSAAEGLQSGFQMGLQANAAQDARDQRTFENNRQTAADARQASLDSTTATRQATADSNTADDRALAGLNSQMEDSRFALGSLHAKYPDGQVPESEAAPLKAQAIQLAAQRTALLQKRSQPIIDTTTQKWRDFASHAQAGDPGYDPSTLRGQDLIDFVQSTTGHTLQNFSDGTVGKSISDATAGLGSNNMPLVINAADTLLSPQIKQNLGGLAPDGSQIIDKSLYALVPAPAQGMQPGQQNPALSANPVQGLMGALNAATGGPAPAPATGAPPAPTAGAPPSSGLAPAGPAAPPAPGSTAASLPSLQPGGDPGLVMPVLNVTTRQPDGSITSYHAPVTDGRNSDPSAPISPPLQTSDLMDRMGRLGVVDNWLKSAPMADAVQDAIKSSSTPTTFQQAWAAVHGNPSDFSANGKTDPTSLKIAAIKQLAADQKVDFGTAANMLAGGKSSVLQTRIDAINDDDTLSSDDKAAAIRQIVSGGSGKSAAGSTTTTTTTPDGKGGTTTTKTVGPAGRAGNAANPNAGNANVDTVKIMTDEVAKTQADLAALKANPNADPAAISRKQDDLTMATKALAAEQKKAGTSSGLAAGPSAAPTKAPQLTGQPLLDSLDPSMATNVKALAEGRIPATTFSIRNGERANMVALAGQYKGDGSYNANDSVVAAATEKAFTSGKQSQSVKSFNTAIDHLGTLGDLATALGNNDIKTVNQINNAASSWLGQTPVTNFDTAKRIVADEVVKAIVGAGGALADRDEAAKTILNSESPQQLAGAIQTYKSLMGGQLGALRLQYNSGQGKHDFSSFLSPAALAEEQRHTGVVQPSSGLGGGAPAPAPAPAPTAGGGAPRSFNSTADAAAAGLKDGTPIIVNGRPGKWFN